MAGFETIRVREEGKVLEITLDRPERKNAMSRRMVRELAEVARDAAIRGSDALRALVLRGAGGTFCSGGDLEEMSSALADPPVAGRDAMAALNAEFGHLAHAYAELDVPVVAVLEGAVMGGGFGLACVADVILAAPGTRFRLPEASLGIVPAQIAPFLLRRIGYAATLRLALSGETLDALAARELGLVHEVAADVDAALARTLKAVFTAAPEAARATKRLLREVEGAQLDADSIERAAAVFADCARGPEAAEGMAAFLAKRAPGWVRT